MTKKLRYVLISGFITLAAAHPAIAGEYGLQQVFYSLHNAARGKDETMINAYITANSQPTVHRLLGYNLESCLPQNLNYAGERYEGDYVYVTASTPYSDGRVLTSELAFKKEDNQWKLDVPESFRNGLGNGWEQKLNQIEMLYTGFQAQFGGQINCGLVQDMLRNTPTTGSSEPRIIAQ